MTERIDAMLDALQRDQPADLSIERTPGGAEVRVGPDTIASVDERHQQLVVYAPADTRSKLLGEYKTAKRDPLGVAFDLSNDDHAAAGFELVRHRARVQRVGWQYRERSP
ncbi:MAG TPA: hypothetical protein VMJ65_08140 [Solirubrobacteraceae bacterium]|nr:hypothetical protein [Solirubrobacteraceae bacterium]